MRGLAFLTLFSCAVPAALTSLQVSILLWVWISLLVPNAVLWGIVNEIPYNKLIVVLTCVAALTGAQGRRIRLDKTSWLLLLYLVLAAISQATSEATPSSAGWTGLDFLWKSVLLNILIISFARSQLSLYSLALMVALALSFQAVGDGLKFMLSGGSYQIRGSPLGDNNFIALALVMAIPFLGYVRDAAARQWLRLAAQAGVVLFVCTVISTNSRGGFVGLCILAISAFWYSRHKVRYLIAILAVAAVFSQVVPKTWTQRMDTIHTAGDDSSFMGRVIAWKISTLIALDNPISGGGLYSVQSPNVWNKFAVQFDRLSFIPTEPPGPLPRAAHSIYFQVLGDTGFLGLAVYLSIIASSLWNVRQTKRLSRGREDLIWARNLAVRLQLSLFVFVVSGAALSAAYKDLNMIIFGMVSAVRWIVQEQTQHDTRAQTRRLARQSRSAAPAPVGPRPDPVQLS